jgi:3',5'-cyclic AMP phosphodiesterase CpdA
MRTLTIGDIHGKNDWEKVNHDDFDMIVFLGDYVDSRSVDDNSVITNLEKIVAFKNSLPQKVKLLTGNHENSYLFRRYRTTGYRYDIADEIRGILTRNADLFQVAWQTRNYLWTHAGIHEEYYNLKIASEALKTDGSLAETLERLYREEYRALFEVGFERGGWDQKMTGGPFWIDKSRLLENPLRGYHQIVGHTPVETVENYTPYEDDDNTSVTFCDCIEWGDGSFYTLEI